MRSLRPNELPAWQAAALLQRRELSAELLMRACLERIGEREPQVQAFVALDTEAALAQARALDAGALRGPLHGLPLGVKDLFDTADLPTAYGTPIYAGFRPAADAAAVALAREAGALVIGKTVSTELATMRPGPTRNPHDLARTPGGSSSGSAAAVADRMLPLALGTQTAGSIIRPAAYCGVVGYKPGLGRVPRAGIKLQSESFDTAGGFGRTVRDAALLGAVLLGDARLASPHDGAAPRIGLAATPLWPAADDDTQRIWAEAVDALAPRAADCREAELPAGFEGLVALQEAVMCFEAARSFTHERVHHADRLSAPLRAMLEEGLAIDAATHARHLAAVAGWRAGIDSLFERHDLLLTPSAAGAAPPVASTGDPLFCRAWSLLGLPCIHLPFGGSADGLPLGLQLVGRRGADHRLVAAAQWVEERLAG